MLKPVSVSGNAAAPKPEFAPDCTGGTGRARKVPLGTCAGDAGLVCQLRLVTVTLADSGVDLPPAETVTETVPPVTIVPDHELFVLLLVTVLLLESVNFQPEKVAPVGALPTLQVMLPARATDDGQLRFITLSPPLGLKSTSGHCSRQLELSNSALALEVVEPTETPVWTP